MKLKILEFATKLEQIKSNLELNEYILDSVKPKERFPIGYDFSENPMIKNKKSEIEFLNNKGTPGVIRGRKTTVPRGRLGC